MSTILVEQNQSLIILLIILGIAAVIAVVAYILYRVLHLKAKDEVKDENQIAKEELDRILEPIEDEEVSAQISQYDQDEEEQKNKE